MVMHRKEIVVVVPIYNAFEILTRCLTALERHTDLASNVSIVLIDDCSTDSRIRGLLTQYVKSNWTVLENSENLGFPKTTNRGIRFAKDADVVLLNSDVVVHEGWLTELSTVAYSSQQIATVTALSNNASIYSWPPHIAGNENIDPELACEIAKTVAKADAIPRALEIPFGIGHCLYMKRESIDAIGYFDEEKFGAGYGEEVDFCLRANRAGFKHVLAARSYVYHQGAASMRHVVDVDLVKDQNNQTLERDFPECSAFIKRFLSSWPCLDFRTQVTKSVLASLCNQRRRILFVSPKILKRKDGSAPEFPPPQTSGDPSDRNAVFILERQDDTRWDLRLHIENLVYTFCLRSLGDSSRRQELLDATAPDCVYFRHASMFPLGFLEEVSARGIPSELTSFLPSNFPELREKRPNSSLDRIWRFVSQGCPDNWSASFPDGILGSYLYRVSQPFFPDTRVRKKEAFQSAVPLSPEFIGARYGQTRRGRSLGLLVMIYLRLHSVGIRKTLARPLKKFRNRAAELI